MGSSGDSTSRPLTNLGQGSKMRLAPPARWAPRRGQRERQWPSGLRGRQSASRHRVAVQFHSSLQWTQRGGQLCQFLLGLVQKNPKRRLESGSPPPQIPQDPKLASPPHSPPNLVCGAVRNDGTGTKQGAGVGWGPGQGVDEVLGAGLLLPWASKAGGRGWEPGGLPSTQAVWGLDCSPGERAKGPGA